MAGDGDQTRRFLGALHGCAPPGSLVEVRFRLGPGMGQRFLRAERLGQVADRIASLAASTDVFVGVIARARRGGTRSDLAERAAVVWVDCDNRASVAALARFRPPPSIVVASGSGPNRHAYWLLDEPVGSRRSSGSTIVWRSRSARTSTAAMSHGSCDPPARPTASIAADRGPARGL